MCNLYQPCEGDSIRADVAAAGFSFRGDVVEPKPVAKLGTGLYLAPDAEESGTLVGRPAQWGMVPPGLPWPPPKGKVYSTNNARIETIASKKTFAGAWRHGKRCLIPATWYQEPNWELKRHVRWRLKRADGRPWYFAGLWSDHVDRSTGEVTHTYTAITCNCDGHPLLARLHKPDDDLPADEQDKRSLVHIEPHAWRQWLFGSEEQARELLVHQPAGVFDQSDAYAMDDMLKQARSDELF